MRIALKFALAALISFALGACQPHIIGLSGEGYSPNYPSLTPLGNPQGSTEHRMSQPNYMDGLDATDSFDPIYDTFCTFDDHFVTWVCPKYATDQEPDIVDRLNSEFVAYAMSLEG